MWIDDQGELARQVHDAPLSLLTKNALLRCYCAPTSELRELLGVAVERAVENPYAQGEVSIDESRLGEPGQVLPPEFSAGFQQVQTWPELRDYVRVFVDEVPVEWSWDAWLLVYVMISDIHSARIRRCLARSFGKMFGVRAA
jgi:hypothetical protein